MAIEQAARSRRTMLRQQRECPALHKSAELGHRRAVALVAERRPAFDRPIEPARLVGNAEKIRKTLGWKPSGNFEQLVREMVEAEVEALRG